MSFMHGGAGNGDSEKLFGGVFAGFKTWFNGIMDDDSDVLSSDEYLEDAVDDSDITMEVSENITAYQSQSISAKKEENIEGFFKAEPVMARETAAPVASSKIETVSAYNHEGGTFFVNPADFFGSKSTTVSSKENKGGSVMATENTREVPSYGTSSKTERVGSVGFNYSQTSNEMSGSSAGRTFAAQKASSSAGTTVQFFEPSDTKQADDICTVLKAGHIVVVNLCKIREESDKIRIIDFVAGCCKGIDAKAHTIAPKSIFIAAPKGVELRKPINYAAEAPVVENNVGTTPFFGGINFGNGVPEGERNLNAFEPKF